MLFMITFGYNDERVSIYLISVRLIPRNSLRIVMTSGVKRSNTRNRVTATEKFTHDAVAQLSHVQERRGTTSVTRHDS
jgi:V8-like Glu-specific endopeptidase